MQCIHDKQEKNAHPPPWMCCTGGTVANAHLFICKENEKCDVVSAEPREAPAQASVRCAGPFAQSSLRCAGAIYMKLVFDTGAIYMKLLFDAGAIYMKLLFDSGASYKLIQ